MKIPRPDDLYCDGRFRQWFIAHVEPINRLLSEGVEVYQRRNLKNQPYESVWTPDWCHGDTNKALLINIQPLKKETAEDVLRDLVRYCEEAGIPHVGEADPEFKLYNRAKALLERK